MQIRTSDEIIWLSLLHLCGAVSIFKNRRKWIDQAPLHGLSSRAVILIVVLLYSISQSSRNAVAQDASSTNASPRSEQLLTCPSKSPQGTNFIEMGIAFSVEKPMQEVTCLYSDGYRITFAVEKGCDIEPTGIIADAIGPRGSGFTQGRHQCLDSEAGAGKCHVVCRH